MTGCQSTKQPVHLACQFGVNLSFSSKLTTRPNLNYQEISDFVSDKYREHKDNALDIELVKAHVNPRASSLRATAVVTSHNLNNSYFRGTEVDISMISAKAESQSALHSALTKAINKAVFTKHSECVKNH